MFAAVAASTLVARRWPINGFDERVTFVDAVLPAVFVGVLVGRITTLLLDDPSSLRSLADVLIIRSGVEFWPGVAAAMATITWTAHRANAGPVVRLASLAPLAMIGYGAYEAACVFRDGCFGPQSPIGLRPPGLTTTMIPVGTLMAAVVWAGALLLHRSARARRQPMLTVLGAIWFVAVARSVGSVWLPTVQEGLTRQHRTSIMIAALTGIAMVALALRDRRQPRPATRNVPSR